MSYTSCRSRTRSKSCHERYSMLIYLYPVPYFMLFSWDWLYLHFIVPSLLSPQLHHTTDTDITVCTTRGCSIVSPAVTTTYTPLILTLFSYPLYPYYPYLLIPQYVQEMGIQPFLHVHFPTEQTRFVGLWIAWFGRLSIVFQRFEVLLVLVLLLLLLLLIMPWPVLA